jgi:hypothetical protein
MTEWLTHSMVQSPYWKADSRSANREILRLYVTRSFITIFTTDHHWSLSWARWIQCISSHPVSQRSILILTSPLGIGFHSWLFPSGYPTKTSHASFISPIRATCSAQPILLASVTVIMKLRTNSKDAIMCRHFHGLVSCSDWLLVFTTAQ